MKKIYASMFALAMGACITAGARTYQRANVNFDGLQMKTFETVGNVKATDMKVATKAMKVKANAGEEWVDLGTGIFVEGIFGLGQLDVTVQESASTPGYYRVPDAFTFIDENALPFKIDATDPTYVRIPEQETGINVNFTLQDGTVLSGPLTILSYSAYADMLDVSPAEFKAAYPEYVISMEDGVITMPELSILGIIGNSDDIIMINDEMVLALPGANYVPEWGDIQTGQMLDTFFEADFEGYEATEVNVPIQKNNKVEGVYRVIDPWFKLFGAEEADPTETYYFYIDASDPDCIVVPYQTSYIRLTDYGTVYIMSMSANYETKAEFLASPNAGCNFKMDVATRTINFTGSTVQLANGSTAHVGPLFFVYPQSANPNSMYVLQPYETPGYIKLPDFTGINSVAVDNSNAEVEYYNIQGVRVNNPVAGQLYIVKKGNEVSKKIMR